MTVTTTANSISYAGNGVTTGYSFPFIFFAPTDLVVTLVVTATGTQVSPPPVLNGGATYDYTVTGTVTHGEYASGGTVTFNTAPPGGTTVSVVRDVPATQDVTLIDNTKFPAQTVNTEFDKLTVLAQQSDARIDGLDDLEDRVDELENEVDNIWLAIGETPDVLPPADGNGLGAGTDIVPMLQVAVDNLSAAGGGIIYIHHTGTGIYRWASRLQMKPNVTVRVADGVRFDLGNWGCAVEQNAIQFRDLEGEPPDESSPRTLQTSSAVGRAATQIATVLDHGMAAGDWGLLCGQRSAMFEIAGLYRLGGEIQSTCSFNEWVKVAEVVDSKTIRLADPLEFPDYNIDDVAEGGIFNATTNPTGQAVRARTVLRKMSPCTNAHWYGGEFLYDEDAFFAATSISATVNFYGAVDCSVNDTVFRSGRGAGRRASFSISNQCVCRNLSAYGDPGLDYDDSMHQLRNHFVVSSSQDCGFVGCRSEYGTQPFDFTFGGGANGGGSNLRPYAIDCMTWGAFSGATSHPGCYQERWTGNGFLACKYGGLLVRSPQAAVWNNVVTGQNEMFEINPVQGSDPGVGIQLSDGYATGVSIENNRVSGFRHAFRISDVGANDAQSFRNVNAYIAGNMITNCHTGLETAFNQTFVAGRGYLRGITYSQNYHWQMDRFIVDLDTYSAGVEISDNALHGAFINAGAAATGVAFVRANAGNCPALTITGNKWYRSPGTAGEAASVTFADIGDVADITTFPAASWEHRTTIRNNVVPVMDGLSSLLAIFQLPGQSTASMVQTAPWADGNLRGIRLQFRGSTGPTALSTTLTEHLPVQGVLAPQTDANETLARTTICDSDIIVTRIYAALSTAPGAGTSRKFELRRNNVTVAAGEISVTVSNTAIVASATFQTGILVTAGGWLSIRSTLPVAVAASRASVIIDYLIP